MPQNLTIAYDAKRAYLNNRGLGNYCRTLLAQMSRYYGNNRYLLCTPKDNNMYPWLHESPFEQVRPNGIWRLSPSLWRRCGISKTLQNKHIDIYHGLSQELPTGIEALNCKTVVTMHDAIFMRYPELYSTTYRLSFIRRNRSACERADRIIAISKQTKRDFMDFFGVDESRIRVVYQGCNDIFWQPVTTDQISLVSIRYSLPQSFVLSVGALEERKNYLRLIHAMAYSHIGMPLVIVGKGNKQHIELLYNAAGHYGIALRVITNVLTEDLPAIYHQAAVFVYPSLFEGFGIPVLEAARCGTPIVASSGICFEEITGHGALYVSPLDEQAIGNAILQTIEDPERTTQRIQLALTQTDRFRADKIAQDMMQVYQELMAE